MFCLKKKEEFKLFGGQLVMWFNLISMRIISSSLIVVCISLLFFFCFIYLFREFSYFSSVSLSLFVHLYAKYTIGVCVCYREALAINKRFQSNKYTKLCVLRVIV